MVGSVSTPTVESLAKQLHELLVKQSVVEASKVVAPLLQNANIYSTQSSQKGNQQPGGKMKKGKKGEGNQNKQNPTNNADGGKKDKKKVKFPCKLCQGDHLTYQFPLKEQAQKLLMNQQPVVLKDPFPQGQNAASASNVAGGTPSAPTDQNYINMGWSSTFLQTRNNNYESEAQDKGKSIVGTSTIYLPYNFIFSYICKGFIKAI